MLTKIAKILLFEDVVKFLNFSLHFPPEPDAC